MESVIAVYKPLGLSPLQTIHRLQKEYPQYQNHTISYAGRLDPMAEGVLLLLIGDENKNRKAYEDLQKTYEFEVLLGIETDTYDLLGIPNMAKCSGIIGNLKLEIKNLEFALQQFVGKQVQPYPPYSSKPVQGKPLYWWARENKLHKITIPSKEIEIFNIKLLSHHKIMNNELRSMIYEKIKKVSGDFRQADILQTWDEKLKGKTSEIFSAYRLQVTCSSGTYVRSITHNIGKQLGCGAVTLSIKRTAVGKYHIENCLHVS